jgi:hypothetical protein
MLHDAATVFRQLVEEGSQDPLHLSYCGLLTATAHGKPREGVQLCERAVAFGAYEPEIYLNLVRVYELCGLRSKAVETLRRGLRQTPGHKAMLAKIEKLSPRRKPPLSMVSRDHPANKQLAIMLAKLRGEYSRDEGKPGRGKKTDEHVVSTKRLVHES